MSLMSTGCASLAFRPSVQSIGEYKNTQAITDKAEGMDEHAADDVKVLVEALPEGMAVKDGDFVYDKDRYELLGKVGAQYKDASMVNMGLWGYGYNGGESWRTGLCVWQIPLSWVTLTMWSWLAPTYYPCRVTVGSEEDRRAHVVEAMQRAAKALGGDLVIVAGFGGINFVTVSGSTVVGANTINSLNGTGYAFKVKHGPSEAKPVKGTTTL
jgi:hypothetical protein